MNVENPEISLVIPCYNEEGNVRELIKAVRAAVDPLKISYEVVITTEVVLNAKGKIAGAKEKDDDDKKPKAEGKKSKKDDDD